MSAGCSAGCNDTGCFGGCAASRREDRRPLRDGSAKGLYDTPDRRGPSIALADGGRFFILAPEPGNISVETIAHALGALCRFTGHTTPFYSVAQHCVHVSRLVEPELAMAGLFHDASEAFIGDVSRPLKTILEHQAPGVLRAIEDRLHDAIAERFGVDTSPHDPRIKAADLAALATEKRDLMPSTVGKWVDLPEPDPEPIRALQPELAARAFLRRYEWLTDRDAR